MNIKINLRIPADDAIIIWDYATPESRVALIAAAQEIHGNYYDLTLGQFLQGINGNFESLFDIKSAAEFYWVQGFCSFVDEFINALKRLQIKQTAEERRASVRCLEMTFEEGALIFLQKYFNLESFEKAYTIKVGEFLIAKKAEYNRAAFEKELQELQIRKFSKK